jgi:hypothetical protein
MGERDRSPTSAHAPGKEVIQRAARYHWNTYVATLTAQGLDAWVAQATPVAKKRGLIT